MQIVVCFSLLVIQYDFHKRSRELPITKKTYSLIIPKTKTELECGSMPNLVAALPSVGGGALCSTPQNLADGHYSSAVQ